MDHNEYLQHSIEQVLRAKKNKNNYEYWKQWLIDQENNYYDFIQSSMVSAHNFLNALDKKQFYLGVSTSHYQYEGGYDCVFDKNGLPADAIERYAQQNNLSTPGHAVDLYDNYKEFIPKVKQELGINAMRISIGWSRIEPDEGNFNQEAIARYSDIVRMMLEYGIEPLVCFHHYTNPQWFMDKGDFVQVENNEYFVRFCLLVGRELIRQHCKLFLPINSVQSYGLRAYFSKDQVPKEKNLQKAMEVTANILDAHVAIYHGLKKIYSEECIRDITIPEPQIGLFVVYHPLDPVEQTLKQRLLSLITNFMCFVGNKIQNAEVFSYFKKGTFDITVPIPWPGYSADVHRKNLQAIQAVDFVAISTYSNRPIVAPSQNIYKGDISQHQITESKNYYACPEIIYRATQYAYNEFCRPMKDLYGKDIPILIAENGISTTNEDQRDWYYKQVIISLIRTVKDGYPLIGYFPWTATDCYEWRSGRTHSYGLINVLFEDEQGDNNGYPAIGSVKEGARFFADFINYTVREMKNIN